MASKAIYTVIAVAGIAAASGAAWWYQKPKPAVGAAGMAATAPGQGASSNGAAARPPSVEVARVELAQLVDDTRAVGSLRSRRGVVLRPEISGRITQLNFTDGQRVRKGQVLVQFDDQLPQAQIQQSQAELSIARANQKRNQELVAQNFISQRSLDESAANLQVAQAKLALAKATAARLKIVAPFDGIAGIRQVNVGDYLKDGADIVNIEDIDAIYVDFRLPERYQSKVRCGQTAMLDIDALPGQAYTAQIQAIDPLIDANGRSGRHPGLHRQPGAAAAPRHVCPGECRFWRSQQCQRHSRRSDCSAKREAVCHQAARRTQRRNPENTARRGQGGPAQSGQG